MTDYTKFAPLYDFSLIERAVQDFFCSPALNAPFIAPPNDLTTNREAWTAGVDKIAFYTAFQANVYQPCRPRIYVALNNISEFTSERMLDDSAVYRATAWRGVLRFGIVTAPNYEEHTGVRSVVLAILPQLQPVFNPDGTGIAGGGINAFLVYHEVGVFALSSASTHITPEDGNYHSTFDVSVSFSVRYGSWPIGVNGGTLNPITAGPPPAMGYRSIQMIDQGNGLPATIYVSNNAVWVSE